MASPTLTRSAVGRGRSRVSRGRTFRLVPLGFMAAVIVVTYGVILYTLRRGFDWTDETFAYTLIASNRKTVGEPWGFQHVLHPLYVLTGESVLGFRILRLVGYLLVSAALVWSARCVTRRVGISIPRSGWVLVALLAQVGTFLAWSYPPPGIGYNELAAWFTQLGVALILISLAWGQSAPDHFAPHQVTRDQSVPDQSVPDQSAPHEHARHQYAPGHSAPRNRRRSVALWSIWAGLGALVVPLVFAKATSGLAFGLVLALAFAVPNPYLHLWNRAVALVAGVGGILLALWALQVPTDFYFSNMWNLLAHPAARDAFGHPISEMIATYLASLQVSALAVLPTLLLFALLAVAFRFRRTPTWVRWVLGVLCGAALLVLPKPSPWVYIGEFAVFIGAATIIAIVVLATDMRRAGVREARRGAITRSTVTRWASVAVASLAVLGAPFISSAGTSNAISGQLSYAATLWLVVLGVALVLLAQRAALRHSSAQGVPAVIACVVVLVAAFAVNAHIAAPYRTPPLLTQNTPTSVPALRGLLLTKAQADWADWVDAAGRSLHAAGVPATAVNSPGALFILNHSGYANPWVGTNWPAAYESLRLACASHRPADLFVIEPGRGEIRHPIFSLAKSRANVTRSLAGCGIAFPRDFQVVARRTSDDPYRAMKIYRLRKG
jgi:hypothetical protein